MRRDDTNVDNEKRGKLLLLAAVIALSMFLSKIIFSGQVAVWRIFLDAGIYFIGVIVGLLWAFNFQVKKQSFRYIFHAALFVFSQILFVDFFFFQKFNRIYEALILLILIVAVFFACYFVFLMVNTLNVNLFKPIPLAQVGRTISYISSIFMVYSLTFTFLISGLPSYITIPSILLLYFIIVVIHYSNIEIEGRELLRKALITTLIMSILLASVIFSGNSHEIISIMPVVGYFISVNMVTHERISSLKNSVINIYILLLLITLIFVFIINIQG